MKRSIDRLWFPLCAALFAVAATSGFAGEDAPAAAAISKIQRVSVSAKGVQADAGSHVPALSPDGTEVAFISGATTLMAGGGGLYQVYVKNLATGRLKRVSTTSAGIAGNGNADNYVQPMFSPDGTKLLFTSYASNLVPGDTNGFPDVFEKNLVTGAIRRISTTSSGGQADSVSYWGRYSPDGKKVIFASEATNLVANDTNGRGDVFVKDLATGKVQRVSLTWDRKQANNGSSQPSFSPDGKKIVFYSEATNLVPGDTNGNPDVFVRDLSTGAVSRANVSRTGVQSDGWDIVPGRFHPDGKHVVFASKGTQLIAGDTNGVSDVFWKTLATGGVKRLSTGSAGQQIAAASSAFALDGSGNLLAFAVETEADPVSTGIDRPAAVVDGNDLYVKHLDTGAVARVSTNIAGVRGNGTSTAPDVSADGKLVAFVSYASNLLPGDTNGVTDIFVVTLK